MSDTPRAMQLATEGTVGGTGASRGREPVAGAVSQQLADALVTAIALMSADAGAVFVRRPTVGLVLAAEMGLSADELVRLRASPVRPDLAPGAGAAVPTSRSAVPGCILTHRPRDAAERDRAGGFATVCTMPVTTPSGERWGLVELYFRRTRRIPVVRRQVGEAFVRQLGWALERDRRAAAAEAPRSDATPAAQRAAEGATAARDLGRHQRAAERAVRLQTATAALARADSTAEVCQVAVEQCVAATAARAGACFPVAGGALASAMATHAGMPGALVTSTPGALEREALATGRLAARLEAGNSARVALPLVAADDVLAVLSLDYEPPRPFDDDDREYLSALVRVAAQALERVRLYVAARAASQAKSDFLAMMSHELRTPLNAIMGYTGLMADEVVGPLNLTQREQLHRVQEHARHLLTLIEEILTLSRAEAGRDDLRLERVDPAELMREVGQVLAPSALRKGITLDVQVPDVPRLVRTDADKVRQVLAHLLTNAIKFTASGTVTARVAEHEGGGQHAIHFIVRDTGVGIAPEHLTRIFEPFWQADQARTRRFPGTGLGLNVTRRLADLLGGDVVVTSVPGEGSEFVFRLPVRE